MSKTKRFRKRIGGEYGEPSKSMARKLFLCAIERETPEVLEALREILPQSQSLGLEYVITSNFASDDEYYRTKNIRKRAEDMVYFRWKSLCANPGNKVFKEELEEWGRRFNLTEDWIFESAIFTLEIWKGELEGSNPTKSWEKSWVFTLFPSRGELIGNATDASILGDVDLIESALQMVSRENNMFSFSALGWNPVAVPKESYKAYIISAVEEELAEHIEEVEAFLPSLTNRVPEYRTEEHFSWLALYHIRGHTASEIADLYEERTGEILTEDNIMKAIRKTAQWVGLEIKHGKT